MSVALAATWNPRGELPRLQRLLPLLERVYAAIAITLPPGNDPVALASRVRPGACWVSENLEGSGAHSRVCGELRLTVNPDWSWGRYLAIQSALCAPVDHIHYADMDRLLRWVETLPDEWRWAVDRLQSSDVLIFGRTPSAYATHPQALLQTEAISNRVVSALVGKDMDVSAGSKAFSRETARFLVENSSPGRALGTDGEWPVLLQRAGFRVDYVTVDGLDWESADRYQEQAASPERQRQGAAEYDADPQHWAARVGVALEIVQTALETSRRELSKNWL